MSNGQSTGIARRTCLRTTGYRGFQPATVKPRYRDTLQSERATTSRASLCYQNDMTATDIRAAALALPEDERERLAMDLWDSLSRDDGVGDAWAAEIERRVRALENGEVELVSQEDARARIHGRLADLHR